jgi:hypothetical protein
LGQSELGYLVFVPMMKAADLWDRHDARIGPLSEDYAVNVFFAEYSTNVGDQGGGQRLHANCLAIARGRR